MRRISMAVRDELVAAISGRYSQADRTERGRILDEFTAITGFHRKHAMRLLRAGQPNRCSGPRPGRRAYHDATREALIVIWEADLRQAGAAAAARSHRGDGAAWPSGARAGGAHRPTGVERGY